MDLRNVQTFLEIVRTGSFQKAARQLQYAQSTITKQIQNLEEQLGVKLLERGKKLRLTPAGEVFIAKAEHLLRDVQELQQTMSDLNNGEKGVVRIGVMEPTASYRMPQLIKRFTMLYPQVDIVITINNSHTFNQLISDGHVDFGICTTPESGLGTTFEPLFVEEMLLLVPSSHPLSQKKRILLRDLRHEDILLTNHTCPFRRKLEMLLHDHGGSPYRKFEIGNMAALKYYVQAQHGIAAVPAITLNPPPDNTVVKRIENLDSGLITGLLVKKNQSVLNAASRKLIDFIRQELGPGSQQTTIAPLD